MNRNDMSRSLADFAVGKALSDMQKNPQRSLRNLVDMGLLLTGTPAARSFLTGVQSIIKNPNSPYYVALENILGTADTATLKTVGMHIGYDGLAKGAKKLRAYSEAAGIPVPWVLHMDLKEEMDRREICRIDIAIEKARQLGIHVFMLRVPGSIPPELWDTLAKYGDCAYLLQLATNDRSALAAPEGMRNHIACILNAGRSDFEAAADDFRKAHLLTFAYDTYDGASLGRQLSSPYLQRLADACCAVLNLMPAPECPPAVRQAANAAIIRCRTAPTHPIILLDYETDIAAVSQLATGDARLLTLRPDSTAILHAADGTKKQLDAQMLIQLYNRLQDSASPSSPMYRPVSRQHPAP